MGLNDVRSPGDQLKIAATDWNDMLAAARKIREHRSAAGELVPQAEYPATIALVRNDSNQDFNRFDAAGLNGPLTLPSDDLPEFQRQPMFSAVLPATPTHVDLFGICLEPIAQGSTGAALIAGCGPAQITGSNVGYAEIQNGSTVLTASATGSARVLFADSGTGQRWALVRLGEFSPGGITATVKVCDSTGTTTKTLTITNGIITGIA